MTERMLKDIAGGLVLIAGMCGCVATPLTPQDTKENVIEQDLNQIRITDLVGAWEYQDGNAVYPLTFDEKGNGAYEWKHGRFVTTSLKNGVWKGSWHQRDNDREGGFEMRLARDLQTADGHWWYTRIGEDHDPLEPGGTFTLRRLPCSNFEDIGRAPCESAE